MTTITTPSLKEMKERKCTLEELQAKLIEFIEHYNKEMHRIEIAINSKEDRVWRATI